MSRPVRVRSSLYPYVDGAGADPTRRTEKLPGPGLSAAIVAGSADVPGRGARVSTVPGMPILIGREFLTQAYRPHHRGSRPPLLRLLLTELLLVAVLAVMLYGSGANLAQRRVRRRRDRVHLRGTLVARSNTAAASAEPARSVGPKGPTG